MSELIFDGTQGTINNPIHVAPTGGGDASAANQTLEIAAINNLHGTIVISVPTLHVTIGDYVDGDCIGGLLTLTGVTNASTFIGTFKSGLLTSKVGTFAFKLWIFNSIPTNATITDHAALVLNGDENKLIGYSGTTDWELLDTLGVAVVVPASYLDTSLQSLSTNLYCAISLKGSTVTPTTINDLKLSLTFSK